MSRRKRSKLKDTKVIDEQKPVINTADAFSNPLSRTGFGMPNLLEATEYPLTRFTQNYQEINSLYRSHWVVQKIINVIPQDMLKNGYDIQTDLKPEQIQEVLRIIRKTRLHAKILEGLYWGRLYGGAIGVMLIDGEEDLSQPLDLDQVQIGAFKGMLILDRWNGVSVAPDLVDDINDDEFGMPKYYDIQLNESSAVQRIHHSRVCRFVGREMPYLEKVAETYWGTSELEHIIDELKKRDNVSWNIALLTFMANIRILKLEGMEQILSTGDERVQQRLYNTIEGMNQMLNSNALQVLGKDDDFVTQQYTFSGLGDVYDRFMMDVSGACGIPATKLFGRSPAGMNATGESDLQNYYDTIEANQESQLRPVLDKLLPVIFTSALGAVPDDLDYVFNPIRRSQDVEKQNIGSQQTQAVVQAFTAGLISQKTALSELQGSSKLTGMWTNITDEEISRADDEIESVGEAPMMPMMDADFDENKHKRDNQGRFASNESGESKEDEPEVPQNIKHILGKQFEGVVGIDAINKVRKEGEGYVLNAYTRTDVGGISVLWGDNRLGIQHIINRRKKQGWSEEEIDGLFSDLDSVIKKGTLTQNERGTFEISLDGKMAIISPKLDGNNFTFLLTAFWIT